MELDKIEALLAKYEEGNTSLAEEKSLREYFTSGDVPSHLEEYKLIFTYVARENTAAYPREIKVETHKKRYAFTGIAASIVLAVGLFVGLNNGQEDLNQQDLGTIEDPQEAYEKAKESLQLISAALNSGREDLAYIEEFDKAKNKYIKE